MEIICMTCRNCGGKLEITRDTDQFICRHCGSEYLVLFTQGAVSIKLLSKSVRNIEAASDKTASELALKRIDGDLKALFNDYHIGIIVDDLYNGSNPWNRARKLGMKIEVNEIGWQDFGKADVNTLWRIQEQCREAKQREEKRMFPDKEWIKRWEEHIQKIKTLVPKFQALWEQRKYHLDIVNR